MELSIYKNKIVDAHVLDIVVSFFVIQGIGELTVGNNKYMLTKGDLISVDSGLSRCWVNKGSDDLKLLAIKEI